MRCFEVFQKRMRNGFLNKSTKKLMKETPSSIPSPELCCTTCFPSGITIPQRKEWNLPRSHDTQSAPTIKLKKQGASSRCPLLHHPYLQINCSPDATYVPFRPYATSHCRAMPSTRPAASRGSQAWSWSRWKSGPHCPLRHYDKASVPPA